MSLSLLLPAGLAALAALLLPLLLHLARRAEQKPTDFAALRWLRAMPRPRQKLRFEEWLLLALRLLLVALLALWLAQPVLHGGQGDRPWIAVAPGVSEAQARSAASGIVDGRWHWLAPGFPGVEQPLPAGTASLSSLLRELDARLPASTPLVVVVPDQLHGLDAERMRLGRSVDWRVVGGTTSPKPAVNAAATPPTLVIRHAPETVAATRYLAAAATAWQGRVDSGDASQRLPANTRWLAWWVPGPLPAEVQAWIAGGGIVLLDATAGAPLDEKAPVVWRDGEGRVLARAQAQGRGRVVQLQRPLLPSQLPALLDPGFPTHLRALLDEPTPLPGAALAEAVAPVGGGPGFPETPRPLQPWLALLIAFLFLVERWFASARRQRVAA